MSISEFVDKYTTLGVWVGAPLGVSGRFGLAIPLTTDGASLTAGAEVGLQGTKMFVGLRHHCSGAWCLIWGGIDAAHWKLNSHPWVGEAHQNYNGIEVHFMILRAGVMVPEDNREKSRFTFGIGLSF